MGATKIRAAFVPAMAGLLWLLLLAPLLHPYVHRHSVFATMTSGTHVLSKASPGEAGSSGEASCPLCQFYQTSPYDSPDCPQLVMDFPRAAGVWFRESFSAGGFPVQDAARSPPAGPIA